VGLISPSLHKTFTDAIDALLADGACATPCELIYGNQKFVECANCQAGIYRPGGMFPFPNGKVCPSCNGKAHVSVNLTECINLLVTFDAKDFRVLGSSSIKASQTSNSPVIQAETMCRIELYPKLKAAEYLVIDVCNECYVRGRYKRITDPYPCGLGRMDYILVGWERVN